MSLREALRKMASEKNGPTRLMAVLNDPTKLIAVPVTFCEELLALYKVHSTELIGDAPFHIIFVLEGVVFGILSKEGERGRITLHGVDLRPGEEVNIEVVGSEIYDLWKSFPRAKLLTYVQLQKRAASLHNELPKLN